MTRSVGRRVVEVARRHNLLCVCDDVYNLLHYNYNQPDAGHPPSRLFSVDRETGHLGNVISNGTFSKTLGPGVRVGWLEVRECIFCQQSRRGAD